MNDVLRISLPAAGPQALLWSELLFAWSLLQYGHALDPVGRAGAARPAGATLAAWRTGVVVRAIVLAGLVVLLAGPSIPGLCLAGALGIAAAALPVLRRRSRTGGSDRSPELELAVTLFLVRGGTHVVRGVLEKSDTLPDTARRTADAPGSDGPGGRPRSRGGMEDEEAGEAPVVPAEDAIDVRHGVTIGNLERFVVLVLTTAGAFGAVGLVLAAKGIVRAVEWQHREMVEYFLVGTLASVALALAVGLALRGLVEAWM